MCQVGWQHAGTSSVQVKPVWPKKMLPLPEHIKVIDEANMVWVAGREEPGVEAEQPAEVAYPSATGGGGAGDKNSHLGLWDGVKKVGEVLF